MSLRRALNDDLAGFKRPARPSPRVRAAALALALALAPALVLAGCLAPRPAADEWTFSGTFTEAATQAEMDALGRELRDRWGVDMLVMESFPEQLLVRGLSEAECPDARGLVAAKPFVLRVGECREVVASADPDAPTSS